MIQNESQRPRIAGDQLKSGTSFGLVILSGLPRTGPGWQLTLRAAYAALMRSGRSHSMTCLRKRRGRYPVSSL